MKYFYTDALKAAWMAGEFEMKFECPDDVRGETIKPPVNITKEIVKGRSGIGDSPDYIRIDCGGWHIPEKHYIHLNCHEMLKPQVGDVGIDSEKQPCAFDGKYWLICNDCNDYGGGYYAGDEAIIIQRNGKAFFMPESED